MSKIFVKKSDLALINGGYLVTGKNETPVFNEKFISILEQKSLSGLTSLLSNKSFPSFRPQTRIGHNDV